MRIGTSGYQYPHWRGIFYPEDLPQSAWFTFYARHFDTVEINTSFYGLPSARTVESWHDLAPQKYCFAMKYSRFGTHLKRLRDPEQHVGLFLERVERLKSFLGPILVQLPPRWKACPERLDAFLKVCPRRHRWAVEFRDPSWLCEEVYRVLRRHDVALCIHDHIADHPREITADWTYVRFNGTRDNGNYGDATLREEAKFLRNCTRRNRGVYAYFNNDSGGHAITNAKTLREMLRSRLVAEGKCSGI